MASEDVIELGSSDDEAEPASKKIKKPVPNAMVHIPTKLHGVTIKPAKAMKSRIPKQLAGKNVTITKISKPNNVVTNPYANKNKTNGKQMQKLTPPFVQLPKSIVIQNKPVVTLQNKPMSVPVRPIVPQNITGVNPLNFRKKINNSQVVINKVSPNIVMKNPVRVHSPRSLNNLPPSITITRTSGAMKRAGSANDSQQIRKKQRVNPIAKGSIGEVLTVELDDDEVSSSSTASPQWYLRPEDQGASSLEEANNKEPEPIKMEEITIEDSPIKPLNKKIDEVVSEFTVTIDDSPVKVVTEKSPSGSEDETKTTNKVPHSKKKLEYPKETETVGDTIEIEILPILTDEKSQKAPEKHKEEVDNIIDIEESPIKVQGLGTSTPKKNQPKPSLETSIPLGELLDEKDKELEEFHPVYQSFIQLCFQLENSDDMKKIVEKKIKTYYRQVPKEYTESEEFNDMVSSKIIAMKAGPEKMYLYIKDIVDELNLQRKIAKSQVLNPVSSKTAESDKFLYGEESEYDSKRQRQIRKLEKTLKKLHRAIQKLEQQEVDFDDEEDSVYLLTESDDGSSSNKDSDKQLEKDSKALLQRYKERMVRVHAKFCQLTNTKMPSEPRVQIDARHGHPNGPAKRLEKWVNKKVPIGTPLPFPDFHDVIRCVREANDEDKLGWNEADIMEEARDLFTRCGKKLQRRRQENEWRLAASRISVDTDPAESNNDLKKELEENKKVATKKEVEVFNKYADRQSQLKLEAEEIGDKEAEESPVESDDEEPNVESSLENKEKRKERLKRLLHEKTKKNVYEKENDKTDDKEDIKVTEDKETKNENAEKLVCLANIKQIKKLVVEENKNASVNLIEKPRVSYDEGEKLIPSQSTKSKEEAPKPPTIENKKDIKEVKTPSMKNEDHIIEDNIITTKNKGNESKSAFAETENQVSSEDDVKCLTAQDVEMEEVSEVTPETDKKQKTLKNQHKPDESDKILSLSDDSHKVESDIDELHLLQKLHSENEKNSSTLESSDSETPIAISDTLDSSGDSKKITSDVISIENSSYSESETNKDESKPSQVFAKEKVVEELVDMNTEIECSSVGIEKKRITNNDEYNESVEDILLASTDEEAELEPNPQNNDFKLKNNSISTVIGGLNKEEKVATDNESEIKPTIINNVPLAEESKNHMEVDDLESDIALKQDDASSMDGVICTYPENAVSAEGSEQEENAATESDIAEKQEDASSLDSVAFVGSKNNSDVEEFDLVKNNAASDSAEKQDDASSLDSVAFVDSKNKTTVGEMEAVDTNITESDSTVRQDDGSSVDSVAFVQSKEAVDEDTEQKNNNIESDSMSIGETVVEGIDTVQNNTGDSDRTDKQDDVSSVDSVAFVSIKEGVQGTENRDNQINVIESDSTDKQDDATSVDSVAYVSSNKSDSPGNTNSCDAENVIEISSEQRLDSKQSGSNETLICLISAQTEEKFPVENSDVLESVEADSDIMKKQNTVSDIKIVGSSETGP